MTRQMTIGGQTGRFGLGFIRKAVRVSAFVAFHATLATATFAQDAPATGQGGSAPANWMDQVQAYRQRLQAELNVCGTVKAQGAPGQNLAGYKVCLGTNGFSTAANVGNVTLSQEGLPGTISAEGNTAMVGYSFGAATPAGGATGGIEYNPLTGAVKVSGGPAWGYDAPGSPLGAEVSIEGGVTYTPPAVRPSGSVTAPADWWQAQAALQAAREQQRLQAMTYQQKLAELTSMINQGAQPTQLLDYVRQQNLPASGQYPASAQILTPAQVAAQMNGGMPAPTTVRPQPASTLPPIGAGAYNPPSLPGTGGSYAPSGSTLVFNENAPKIPYSANGQPMVSRPNSTPTQPNATGFAYDPNAPKTAISGPVSQPSQAPVIPNVTPRIPGTQSQTAALEFPGE